MMVYNPEMGFRDFYVALTDYIIDAILQSRETVRSCYGAKAPGARWRTVGSY